MMTPQSLPNFSLQHRIHPPSQPSAGSAPLLLMLHGIGSNEDDLIGLAPYLDPSLFQVSARAPIEIQPGAYAWFELNFTPNGPTGNMVEAAESCGLIAQLIQELVTAYGLDPQRVYLMGFSQGAIMSLYLALTQPELIAGAVVMSGRLPSEIELADPVRLQGLPLLVVHGVSDPVLSIDYGRGIRDRLQALPVQLTYQEYAMGHQVSAESLQDIGLWLKRHLNGATTL